MFLLHLLGFGLISGVTFAGWILNMRFTSESELQMKLAVGSMMRTVGMFSPVAALLLLLTGIGNIYNVFLGSGTSWYQESWLVVKIVLFGILLTNGTLFGPLIARKRNKIVRSLLEEDEAPPEDETLKNLNGQMWWFYIVQSVLILGILYFSVFGPSKHPGFF